MIKAWSGRDSPSGRCCRREFIAILRWSPTCGPARVRLSGAIAKHLADVTIHVSLTHEGDTAAAVAILEAP
ncbi:holo-[acyl-carrier-protein] synthase [Mycobacterium xenopi 4042]|uniref:Holo-[acyl-carrier-protein] synthase n=1 Tax=Mycobacterium xenopi 4042 TaxID=1299334 RepID=X8APL3_MYCXE|nr:holo-[acyl-carrier-protein] synthase [Mycobacterium xenopi 4042]